MAKTEESDSKTQQLTGKKHDIVTKYLADQLGLMGHIYQAVDKQVKATEDEKNVNPALARLRDQLEQQTNALRARLEALGGQSTSPLKEAGASILGVAAGVIDKLRAEEVSKDFRDNYTALSLAHISYVMLITTSLACGDGETAGLASDHLAQTAQQLMEIGHLMPTLVVSDLSDLTNLDAGAADQARQRYSDAWASGNGRNGVSRSASSRSSGSSRSSKAGSGSRSSKAS